MLREAVPIEVVSDATSTRPLPPDEGRRAQLMLRLPDGRALRLDRRIRIGKGSDCDVILRDDHVSRRHCDIEVLNTRIVVRDRNSTNGTWVNGTRIAHAELRSGAVLQVGSTRMRVLVDADASALVGESPPMRRLKEEIARVAPSALSVLIHGETGSGKELVAVALHEQSGRSGQFVPVNCGAIPRELVESELFGHERGAFTGAAARRPGVFQEADGGTLFLDEIGELPLDLQPRLLRVLETGMVRPVGASREQPVRVRVLAATHADLRAATRSGRFREDLYYRLVGLRIDVPPLRARTGDVRLLATRFLDELAAEAGTCRLSPEAMERLEAHAWPGNVRELRQVIRRAATFSGAVIEARDLVLDEPAPARPAPSIAPSVMSLPSSSRLPSLDVQREILRRALLEHGGNRRAAAQALGMAKSTFCDRVRRWQLGQGDE